MLRPLVGSAGPCGEDMIFSSDFDEIQEARRFDDPSISQGEWVTTIKEADWPAVIRLGERLLTTKTKDLRLAAWMIEARGKTAGLDGLAEGYWLLAGLAENFWVAIHPLPEDADDDVRVGVLDWLVNQSARLIREIPLTKSKKGQFSSIDREAARNVAKNVELNSSYAEEAARNGMLTMEVFEAALKDTPRTYFLNQLQSAERLQGAIKRLQEVVDPLLGEQSPAFGASLEALQEIMHFFRRQAGSDLPVSQPEAATDSEAEDKEPMFSMPGRMEPSIGELAGEKQAGPIRSREHAIYLLQEIAGYFRRTEPHSPVAYLAQKAAKWGTMPLHQWLRSVVKDDASLSHVEELLGVNAMLPDDTDSAA